MTVRVIPDTCGKREQGKNIVIFDISALKIPIVVARRKLAIKQAVRK